MWQKVRAAVAVGAGYTNGGIVSFGIYNIKKNGFFSYFQDMGMRKWGLCKKYPVLRPFAWIYGISIAIVGGTASLIKNGNVKAQIKEGNEKYDLFEKLGIVIIPHTGKQQSTQGTQ